MPTATPTAAKSGYTYTNGEDLRTLTFKEPYSEKPGLAVAW
jgi:hypothetical protein